MVLDFHDICHIGKQTAVWYSSYMSEDRCSEYEPGLVVVFRLFCGAVALVFFIFSANPPLLYRINLDDAMWFILGSAYLLVFIYLLLPLSCRLLRRFFLPLAIAATILIPVLGLSWQPYLSEGVVPFDTQYSFSISILLLFPLIITAWQYNFRVVTLFFVLLGGIDPLVYLVAFGSEGIDIVAALYSSLIRIVAFMAIGFVITELMKNQRSRQQELIRANEQLKRQAEITRELSRSRERNRLAHELHDVLAHTLSSLAVQLEVVNTKLPNYPEEAKREIDKALVHARRGLNETRRSLRDLRAEPLQNWGFSEAIRRSLEDAALRSGCQLETTISPEIGSLPSWCEHDLYRIIGEATENIVRHANARHIRFEALSEGERFRFVIEDDGIGFDPEENVTRGHVGLDTMTERARVLGGQLKILSPEGGGTRLEVTLKPGRKKEE